LIGCTAGHPFWSDGRKRFVAASDLKPGEILRTADGRPTRVDFVTKREHHESVFNVEVDTEHVYYVSEAGVLVHNAKNCHSDGFDAEKNHMLGEKGVRTPSRTVWRGEGKERIDVENPNPGQRPGQIHYQDNDNNKFLYDPATNSFPDAPRRVNKLLEDPSFAAAIQKALSQYLGEKQ
jgi:hypothetical protein